MNNNTSSKPRQAEDPMNTVHEISLDYLIGFFETDGSLQLIFKEDKTMNMGYRLLPTVVFSQKHTTILECVRRLLTSHQISTRFELGKDRGSNLRIEGIRQVQKFFNLLESKPLYSSKWIDLFIMRAVYSIIEQNRHNTPEGRLEIIDLKFHMHSFSFEDALKKKQSGTLSRKMWEKRHKQAEGSSNNKAQRVLQEMYTKYEAHVLNTQAAIKAQTLRIPGDYISGLIEGDGCLTFSVRLSKKSLSFSGRLSLTAEWGASLLIDVFCAYFGKMSKRDFPDSAIVCSSGKKEILQRLASHAAKHPILGKRPQIEVLAAFLKITQADGRSDAAPSVLVKSKVCDFIKLIYQNSPDRRTRKKTLEELLLEIDKLSFDS